MEQSAFGQARAVAWAYVSGGAADPAYQYNSLSGSITVASPSTGVYLVTLPNMSEVYGITHVVAYFGNHYCNYGGFDVPGTARRVTVNCFSPAGAPQNGGFNILYYTESRANTQWSGGYLFAHQPSASAPYNPSPGSTWNSRGSVNLVQRLNVGSYLAAFPGLGPTPNLGSVMVTTVLGNARCRAEATGLWVSDALIHVNCTNPAGALVDSYFNLSYSTDTAFGANQGEDQRRGAFARAHDASAAAYTPDLLYQYNSAGGPIRARRLGATLCAGHSRADSFQFFNGSGWHLWQGGLLQ